MKPAHFPGRWRTKYSTGYGHYIPPRWAEFVARGAVGASADVKRRRNGENVPAPRGPPALRLAVRLSLDGREASRDVLVLISNIALRIQAEGLLPLPVDLGGLEEVGFRKLILAHRPFIA